MHCDVRTWLVVLIALLLMPSAMARHSNRTNLAPETETVPIHYSHTVTLMVGQNEGRWMRFRIRWDLDDSYLFALPSSFSDSWRTLPGTDAYGQPRVTELLAVGGTVRRIPFVIRSIGTPGDSPETSDGVSYDGVLGLGHASAIWQGWHAHTYQASELTLGEAIPHRKSAPNSMTVWTRAAPMWMALALRDIGLELPYGMVLKARFGDSDGRRFQRLCREAEAGDLVFAAAQQSERVAKLVDMDYTREEYCARLAQLNYTVVIAPASDYTVLPPQMALLTQENLPLQMKMWSGGVDYENAVEMTMFDPRGDVFTVAKNSAPYVTSACTFGDREDFILLGSVTLRRFTWAYDSFTGVSWLTESLSPLSDDDGSYSRPAESYLLLLGAFVWVCWAVILAPNWTPATLVRVPPPSKPSPPVVTPQPPPSAVLRVQRTPLSEPPAAKAAAPPKPLTPAETYQRRISAARVSVLGARFKWPVPLEAVAELQVLTALVTLITVYISIAHMDAVHFISELMKTSSAGAAVAVGGWFFAIFLVTAVGLLAVGRQPDIANYMTQLSVLMALMAIDVSAIRADISVLVLIFLISVSTTVALSCMLCAFARLGMQRAPGVCILATGVAVLVLAASMLVLMPFALERMWGDHPTTFVMGVCMVMVVSVPASLYVLQGELYYPALILHEYGERIRKELRLTCAK